MNDSTNAAKNQSEGARSSAQPAQPYTTNAENIGDEDTEMGGMDTSKPDAAHAASNSEDQGWVMVPKDETSTSAQLSTDKAGGSITGQDNIAQGSSGAQGSTYTATAEPAAPSTAAPGDASLTNFTPGETSLEPSNFDDVSGFPNEDSAGDALAAFTEEQQSGLDLKGFQDSEFGDAFGAPERRNNDDGDHIL